MNNINTLNENNAVQRELPNDDTQLIESDSEEKEIIDGYFDMGLISYEELEFNINSNLSQNRPEIQDIPYLSEDDAKSALENFVSEHFLYGKKVVKELVFTNIECSNSYRYILETFVESRKLSKVFEPFTGQSVLNNGGTPPRPWDIPVKPKKMFQNHKVYVEVPNTAKVKKCKRCKAKGMINCDNCHGLGYKGRQGCLVCYRKGKINCAACKGWAKLKWFIELEVVFETHSEDYIKKNQAVPDDLLRNCEMKSAFIEQNTRLIPINHHHDADLNEASYRLIKSHRDKLTNSKILMQKHEIKVTPITQCSYKWNGNSYKYHVYGNEKKVFAPNYPNKYFCSIL